jgi:AsmA protein
VTDATGQPFKIAGNLSIGWYPWLALRTGPARFGKDSGANAPPIVQWKSARVGARLIPLIQGQLIVATVRLDSPEIHLERGADGAANWNDVINTFRSRPKKPPSANEKPGPQIAGFEIRDGTLTYSDARSGARYSLSGWSLDIGEWRAGATFPLETRFALVANSTGSPAKGSTGKPAAPLQADLQLSARMHVSDDANDIDLFGLAVASRLRGRTFPAEGVPVAFQVSRLAARLSPLDIAISELKGSVAEARLTSAIQAGETGPDKAFYVRGPLSVQIPSVRNFLPEIGVHLPLPLDKATFGAMKLASVWEWNDGAVAVNSIDLQLDETHFNGDIKRTNDAEPAWTIALHGDKIGLSRYVSIEDTGKKPFELPVAMLKALKVQGEVTFEQAWLADAQMKNVRMRLEP